MTEAQRKDRNERLLAECYRTFATKIRRVIASLEADGFRPRIQSAYRSPADQRKAYQSGHSKLLFGYHNVTGASGKPESLAVDILDDGKPLDPPRAYLCALANRAMMEGLTTGIAWGLPRTMAQALWATIADGEVWEKQIGWDSCHVEVSGFTVAEAKSGKRPV